jgi:cytochrome c peroxidase
MKLAKPTLAEVVMDVPTLFDELDMLRDGTSTHSREGDPIAPALADRASRAFTLISSEDGSVQPTIHFPGAVYPAGTTPVKLDLGKGVPQPNLPLDNPLTKEGIALGEKLFVEKKLSLGEGQHCLSCHFPDTAFSDAGNAFSLGIMNKEGLKNSMALFNLAWHDRFFWDGRAPTLRAQVLHPIQDPLELNETLDNVEAKLQTAEYTNLFQKAFASPEVTIEKMALALEQYLFSIISFDSGFDRSSTGQATFTDAEKRGLQLFLTEFDPARGQHGADCFHCHGGFLFTNNRFFNNGLDDKPERGHAIVTNDLKDWGKFKVPSLRNVEVTGPYMHDGRFETLEEVVEHYNSGVKHTATLDANLAKHPEEGLGLSDQDKSDLVAFLKSLTDFEYR